MITNIKRCALVYECTVMHYQGMYICIIITLEVYSHMYVNAGVLNLAGELMHIHMYVCSKLKCGVGRTKSLSQEPLYSSNRSLTFCDSLVLPTASKKLLCSIYSQHLQSLSS